MRRRQAVKVEPLNDPVLRLIADKPVVPRLKRAFRLRGKVLFSDVLRRPTGESVAPRFLALAMKNPKALQKQMRAAWERHREATARIPELDKLASDPRVPMDTVLKKYFTLFGRNYSAGVDMIFDSDLYMKAIKRLLKPNTQTNIENNIIRTILSSSGWNVNAFHDRAALTFLAHQYGSSHQRGGAFSQYNWEWYRRNCHPQKLRQANFVVTDAELLADVEVLREKRGIQKGDFDAVLGALSQLKREVIERAGMRTLAEKELLKYAKPGARPAIKGLTKFASNAAELQDFVDYTTLQLTNHIRVAASARGLSPPQLVQEMLQTLEKMKPAKDLK